MLICSVDEDNGQDESESPKKKDKDKKYLYPHGCRLIFAITNYNVRSLCGQLPKTLRLNGASAQPGFYELHSLWMGC
jgi:hypothetical protein